MQLLPWERPPPHFLLQLPGPNSLGMSSLKRFQFYNWMWAFSLEPANLYTLPISAVGLAACNGDSINPWGMDECPPISAALRSTLCIFLERQLMGITGLLRRSWPACCSDSVGLLWCLEPCLPLFPLTVSSHKFLGSPESGQPELILRINFCPFCWNNQSLFGIWTHVPCQKQGCQALLGRAISIAWLRIYILVHSLVMNQWWEVTSSLPYWGLLGRNLVIIHELFSN